MTETLAAAESMDWQQVVLNGGPPCFHIEFGRFCGRAQRWPGHDETHRFVSLADLLRPLVQASATAAEVEGEAEATVRNFLRGRLDRTPKRPIGALFVYVERLEQELAALRQPAAPAAEQPIVEALILIDAEEAADEICMEVCSRCHGQESDYIRAKIVEIMRKWSAPSRDSIERMIRHYPEGLRAKVSDLWLNAAAPAAEQGKWQPIESAPKDGTHILFCHRLPWAATGNVLIGFWHDCQNEPGWQSTDGGIIVPEVWPHWMPLPEPPTEAAAIAFAESKEDKGREGT